MNCLDEGLLQALIDGELSAERKREAETHLASCAACAAAADDAAQEFALFSRAFTVDESLSVPTARLRANVASAVAGMQPARAFAGDAVRESSDGRGRSFWSSLLASFAPRQLAVFASLAVAAVALAAVFFALRPNPQTEPDGGTQVAGGEATQPPTEGATPEAAKTLEQPVTENEAGGVEMAKGVPKPIKPDVEKGQPKGGPPQMAKIKPRGAGEADKFRPKNAEDGGLQVAARGLLPDEREFVREIAALKGSIERRKSQTLSPTLRAEYERNVAVVDEAIASTRAAVKSNPADKGAQDFLRAAYQEKLDLLSAVAGKSQLASADR